MARELAKKRKEDKVDRRKKLKTTSPGKNSKLPNETEVYRRL